MDDLSSAQHEAGRPSRPASRPRSLWVLMALEGMTSLFGWLWPLLGSTLAVGTRPPGVPIKDVSIALVVFLCSFIGLVVTGGLWRRQSWAFRVGLSITVIAIAIDLFVILVASSQSALAVGAGLALVLNGLLLSFFLRSDVIRTVMAWKQRG